MMETIEELTKKINALQKSIDNILWNIREIQAMLDSPSLNEAERKKRERRMREKYGRFDF